MRHALLLLLALLPSAKADGQRAIEQGNAPNQLPLTSVNGVAQGTTYHIKYYDSKSRNFKVEIDSILADFDRSLSLYRQDSEISEFNITESFTFRSPYFYPVLKKSKEVFEATNGAFDPTVMPLVE